MDAIKAFNELRANPARFLKYHPVNPAAWNGPHTAGQANTQQFRMYKRDGHMPGTTASQKPGHFGATRPGPGPLPFLKREVSSFVITITPPPAGAGVTQRTFTALSVPLHDRNSVNIDALPYYVVDGQGDGLMITGQLSGCTFAWLAVGTTLRCTHIRPVGISATQLHTQVQNVGRFAPHPTQGLTTYGRNDYPGGYANVIGVRRNGQWELYAQRSTDTFETMTHAQRIHPGPARFL